MNLSDAIGLKIERREKDADDFLPICVPENAAEIRRIYKEQRELVAAQQARNEALESLLQAEQDSNHRLSAKELELAARNDALEAERDSLKDSLRRVLRKLPHVDRKILAERHGIKETDHE